MDYAAYQFDCRLTTETRLPPFKGATLRGAFGRSLKNIVCAPRRNDCRRCLLCDQCLYPLVFEKQQAISARRDSHHFLPLPHPFVIRPPATHQTRFERGARLSFHLLLFGPVNSHLPYFIYALKKMGRIGLGRRINGKRGQFVLELVRVKDQVVYSAKSDTLRPFKPPNLQLTSLPPPGEASCRDMTLVLQTPLRTKHNNHFKDKLPFDVLIRTALRRASSLLATYDGAEPDLDYPGLVHMACSVRIRQCRLRWQDWDRYSFRQREKLKLGGLTGSITYADVPDTFLPLLDFASKVHLGKQTTFGLGRILLINGEH